MDLFSSWTDEEIIKDYATSVDETWWSQLSNTFDKLKWNHLYLWTTKVDQSASQNKNATTTKDNKEYIIRITINYCLTRKEGWEILFRKGSKGSFVMIWILYSGSINFINLCGLFVYNFMQKKHKSWYMTKWSQYLERFICFTHIKYSSVYFKSCILAFTPFIIISIF